MWKARSRRAAIAHFALCSSSSASAIEAVAEAEAALEPDEEEADEEEEEEEEGVTFTKINSSVLAATLLRREVGRTASSWGRNSKAASRR